jgi:hypothetical protein
VIDKKNSKLPGCGPEAGMIIHAADRLLAIQHFFRALTKANAAWNKN